MTREVRLSSQDENPAPRLYEACKTFELDKDRKVVAEIHWIQVTFSCHSDFHDDEPWTFTPITEYRRPIREAVILDRVLPQLTAKAEKNHRIVSCRCGCNIVIDSYKIDGMTHIFIHPSS